MHSNETPVEDRNSSEVSAAEVPINHAMDINDSDSDFDDNTSDDDNLRDYELLATQEGIETSGQQTVYYPHNYIIEWLDWDQYEQSLQPSSSANQSNINESDHRSNTTDDDKTNAENINLSDDFLFQRQTIPLTDDRINVIKNLMSNFIIPKDNIPVWAQDLPEEEWKAFLSGRLDTNKVEDM